MPEQDHNAGELDEAKEVLGVILISNYQPAEVVEPGEQTLNLPATFKSPQSPTILGLSIRSAAFAVWCDHFRAELVEYVSVQPVTIIGFVAYQSLWDVGDEPLLERLCYQLYFSRASTLRAYGERKTMAVCDCHKLAALSPLGFSHPEPPFFAGTNVPSMKHSRKSSPPRSLRSCATASSTCSSTLERTQFWNRRCTVWYAPYRSGKSFHGAPVRRIHKMPFKVVRRSLHGRPRRSARTRSGGRMVSTSRHCWSVRSIRNYYTVREKVQETFCHSFLFMRRVLVPNCQACVNMPCDRLRRNDSSYHQVS